MSLVVIVTVVTIVKVTVVTVAVVTAVIVTSLSKNNLTPQQPMISSQGSIIGLSLALRSHDQFPGLSLVLPSPPKKNIFV